MKHKLKRGLVIAVILLFFSVSVIPSTGNIVEKSSKITTKTLMEPPLPPLMWTEDFSTLYLLIPDDPSGDDVYYYIDWGDGNGDWFGPYESNETVAFSHVWDEGVYQIKVKAKTLDGDSKEATYSLTLSSNFKFFYPSLGYVGITYKFTIYYEGYEYYIFDWGDGTNSGWIEGIANKSFSYPGEYELRWKARDIYGYETIWSDPISITILPINGAELEIEIVTGFYTGAIIKNVGDEDTYNVNWCISVKGGMLNLVSVSEEGTINVLPHNDYIGTAVRLRQPVLGFGLVEITATAIGENVELVTEKIDGLLLLFWIIHLS